MATTAEADGPAKVAALVTGDGGWNVFACKKWGADVGKTKRGKGSKIMVMVDGRGVPVSTIVTSAQVAEVNTIETLVDVRVCGRDVKRLIYAGPLTQTGFATVLNSEAFSSPVRIVVGANVPLVGTEGASEATGTDGSSNDPSAGCSTIAASLSVTSFTHTCSRDLSLSHACSLS